MLINHISVSRKKCYDLCSQQYKFRYHLKVPRPGEEPFYFIYGKIVHRIAEVYVENHGELKIDEIASDLLAGKIPYEDEKPCPVKDLPEDYAKKFKKHLKAIQKLTDKIGTDGIVEHPFYFDLDPPNGKFVKGFIDRLIIKGEGENKQAFIIDYKTTKRGKYRVNSKTVKQDLQLRVYSRVVQKEFGIKAENIKAALYYLEGENIVACQYCDESLRQAESDLLKAHISIEKADPDKVWGKVGWHCKNCDYGTICPFYTPTSKAQEAFDGDMSKLGF